MKTQVALRLEEDLVELAKREAGRQNRSLANLVETVLAEALMIVEGDVPVLSVGGRFDLDGAIVIGADGREDRSATEQLHHLLAMTGHGADE